MYLRRATITNKRKRRSFQEHMPEIVGTLAHLVVLSRFEEPLRPPLRHEEIDHVPQRYRRAQNVAIGLGNGLEDDRVVEVLLVRRRWQRALLLDQPPRLQGTEVVDANRQRRHDQRRRSLYRVA